MTTVELQRLFSTPKGLLIIILSILSAMSAAGTGISAIVPGLAAAIAAAGIIDALVLRKQYGAWEFPDGAVLTGFLVAMVLSPFQPWYVSACAALTGIASKHLFRTRSANVFNPAALGLVAMFYVFGTGQSWWGALPELPPIALTALFATGIFITDRVNKFPLVLTFLGTHYLLFTLTAFLSEPGRVAGVFRAPDLHAALFFAFFILTDPPTSPVKYPHQAVCGVIVATTSYAFFQFVGAAYYLLAGVLVGNVWEAWRRWKAR